MSSVKGPSAQKTVKVKAEEYSKDQRVQHFTMLYLKTPNKLHEKALTMATLEYAKKNNEEQVVKTCLEYFSTCNQQP